MTKRDTDPRTLDLLQSLRVNLEGMVLPCDILPSEFKEECRERNETNRYFVHYIKRVQISSGDGGPRSILKKSGQKSTRKRVRWDVSV